MGLGLVEMTMQHIHMSMSEASSHLNIAFSYLFVMVFWRLGIQTGTTDIHLCGMLSLINPSCSEPVAWQPLWALFHGVARLCCPPYICISSYNEYGYFKITFTITILYYYFYLIFFTNLTVRQCYL